MEKKNVFIGRTQTHNTLLLRSFFSEDVAADIWAAPNMTQQKCWLRKVRLHLFFVCTLCSIVHLCFQPMFLFADTTVLPVLRLANVLHLTKASSNLHTFTSVSYIIFTFRAFSMKFLMLFTECFKGTTCKNSWFLSLIPNNSQILMLWAGSQRDLHPQSASVLRVGTQRYSLPTRLIF